MDLNGRFCGRPHGQFAIAASAFVYEQNLGRAILSTSGIYLNIRISA